MSTTTWTRTTIGIAALVLIFAAPGFAQKGTFEVAAGVGLMKLDDKLGGDTGGALDLRVGYFLSDRFELEAQYLQASTIVEGSFDALTLNALYHFETAGDFVPYLLFGAGQADTELDRPLFSSEPSSSYADDGVAFRAGVGGRFWLGEHSRSSIRIELSAMNEDSFGDDATHVGFTGVFGWRLGR